MDSLLAYARPMPKKGPASERHVRVFRNGRNQAVRIPREFELPVQIDKDQMHQICLPTQDALRKELWVKHRQWAVQSANDIEKIYKCCLLGWKAKTCDHSIASFNVFVVDDQLISSSNDEVSTT